MAKKENSEKPIVVEKLRLFNSRTRETITISDDEFANYDLRLWRIMNGETKGPAI
jgi:hypothetical protein